MKSSIDNIQIKQKLYTYHIAGNDRNLADHGSEREYLYSVGDGYRLLLDVRDKQLNRGNTFLASVNEQNSAFRENLKRIFLSDPYYAGSFDEYFEDDISRIINGKGEQLGWQNMPETIIIPIIDGVHWRLIRIKINYAEKKADILWDDPFGENFSANLRTILKSSIEDKIIKLIKKQRGNIDQLEEGYDFVPEDSYYFKVIDQQGRLSNFYDCGPIIFTNIRDYIRHNNIENYRFSLIDNGYYTVKVYSDRRHEHLITQIRKQDRECYIKYASCDLIDAGRLNDLYSKIIESAEAYKLNLGVSEIGRKISELPDIYINLFHEIIEYNRIIGGEIIDSDEYTEEELRKVYKYLQEEIMNTPIEKIDLAYKKFRELKRYQLDSEENFVLAAYRFANFYTMDGPDFQKDIESNLEKIQSNIDSYRDNANDFIKLGIRILHDPDIYTNVKLKIIESLGLFGKNLPSTDKRMVMQHLEPLIRFQDRVQNYQMLEIGLKSSFYTLTANYELNDFKIWLKKYFIPLFKDPDFSMGVLYNPDHFSQKEPIVKILFNLIENLEDKKEIFLFFLEELQNPNWEIKKAISSIFAAPSEHGILLQEFNLEDIFFIMNFLQTVLEIDIVDEYYTEHTVLNIFKAKGYIFKSFNDSNIHSKIINDHFSLLRHTNSYHVFLRSTEFFIPFYYNDAKRTSFLENKTPLREIIGEDGIINLLQILLLRTGGMAFEKTAKFSVFTVSDIEDIKDRAGSLLTLFAYDENYSNHPLLNWKNYHEYSRKLHDEVIRIREENFLITDEENSEFDDTEIANKILESPNEKKAENIFRRFLHDARDSEYKEFYTNIKNIDLFYQIYMCSEFPYLKYMAMEQLSITINFLYKDASIITIEIVDKLSGIEERLEYREIVEQVIDFLKHGVIENPNITPDIKELAQTKLAEVIAINPQLEKPYTPEEDNSVIIDRLNIKIQSNTNSYLSYFARAQFLIDTNHNLKLAWQDLLKAQELNDFYAPIYYYMGMYLEKIKDTSGAIHQLEMAISMRPCYIEAYSKKIVLHYAENDWVMARIVHKEIVSLYPEYNVVTQKFIRRLTTNIDLSDIPFKSEFDEVHNMLSNVFRNNYYEQNSYDSITLILKRLETFVPEDILDFCSERFQPYKIIKYAGEGVRRFLHEEQKFLEDFIKYIIYNTVRSEYHQYYHSFKEQDNQSLNVEKLFLDTKIFKIYNEIYGQQITSANLLQKLKEIGVKIIPILNFIEKYSVSTDIVGSFTLGISTDLANSYDTMLLLFGLQPWAMTYGEFYIIDKDDTIHTPLVLTAMTNTDEIRHIVFFIPSGIGDANKNFVTYCEIRWLLEQINMQPERLSKIIFVLGAYNFFPYWLLDGFEEREIDPQGSKISLSNFIENEILGDAALISKFREMQLNVEKFNGRDSLYQKELLYDWIKIVDYTEKDYNIHDRKLQLYVLYNMRDVFLRYFETKNQKEFLTNCYNVFITIDEESKRDQFQNWLVYLIELQDFQDVINPTQEAKEKLLNLIDFKGAELEVLLCIDAVVDPGYAAKQDKAFLNFAYQLQLGAQEFHESHRKLLIMEKSDGSNNFDISSTAFGVQQGIEFAPTVRYFFKIFGIDLPKINLSNEFWGFLHFSVGVIKIKQHIDLLPGQMLESGSYYAKLVIYDKLSLQINSEKPINLITFVKACNVDMLVGGTLGLASGSPMYGIISGAAICLNKYQISQEEYFLQTSIRFVLDGAAGLLAMAVLYQQNPLVGVLGIMNVVVMTDITTKVTLTSIELCLNGINSTIFTDDYNEA